MWEITEVNFDVVTAYSRCPDLTGFVAKDNLEKIPLLSNWMRRLYCLFLNRSDIRQGLKTILKGVEQMKAGISMCIYPEGTRNHQDELLPFKEGSLKMAEKTGAPIIPMAICHSDDIFENHIPWIRPANVILEYGKPIYPKELSKEERKFLGAYTRECVIGKCIRKMQAARKIESFNLIKRDSSMSKTGQQVFSLLLPRFLLI